MTSLGDLTREVLVHGPVLRGDVAERLGLSASSMTRLLRPLIASGLLVDTEQLKTGSLGRPARLVDIRPEAARYVGVKITGESAIGVVTDLRASVFADAERRLNGRSLEAVVDTVVTLLQDLVGDEPVRGLGVSIGARMLGNGVVDRAPFLGWGEVALGPALEARVGVPVVVSNDLVALTVAEHWFGLGRGLRDFAVLTVGAGVGYGLVKHDRVVAGRDTDLGLGGHVPLDSFGPRCFLGHRGCSTAMLTIPSIEAQVGVAHSRRVFFEEVLDMALAGDPAASKVLDSAARALGRYIALVANIAMVEHVVIAGEGVPFVHARRAVLEHAIAQDRDPLATTIELRIDDAGFAAWARGASAVAIQSTVEDLAVHAVSATSLR